jgi:DNA-binding NarL/FixJ family response regulator
VLVVGSGTLAPALRRTLGARTRVSATDLDRSFELTANPERNVQAIVVDLGLYGLDAVRDLHALFPEVHIVVLTSDSRLGFLATREGASATFRDSTPPAQVARALASYVR